MKALRLFALLSILLSLLNYPASAVEFKENNLPIVIEAQKLSYNDSEKVAIYTGNVIAQRGNTVMKGDKLTVYFDKTGKFIEKIEVTGNVYIEDPRGKGWCDKLTYYPVQEKLVLEGNAKLQQDKNTVLGDRIVAYKEGRILVEGIKQKVKTVIYPEGKVGESFRP
ncbi:lipopolysaccharide transport periplasmic protein LptA [Phorcysia thermohydrogeniphila]|uniref:Lipopolysaccharide export system protein LptA n=1 Tax=Phorcysia thermohydrogeniphila TaxID=936138 RepID=A0A4R1GHX2_9BACT|nr:lipopolysaccharide transport periplasmic protein LptA [Phorcysia thermohydrogeniphila]TCK06650.1 lipopolysaccharide export system protein LptA [Phorcysia thermohydrogeniphila]